MSITLYNTLHRAKETFIPSQAGKVNMYVCGPTAYASIHIGNARAAVVFDMIRKYFVYRGFEVNYVSNFTDIDDKIINRAFVEGVPSQVIADRYVDEIKEEFLLLGIEKATATPRVTEEIPEIIQMIESLIEKEYAYEINGNVYFETPKKTDYGKLSGHKIENLQAGARIMVGDEKRNQTDFVLWKPAKEGEPFWESPWGKGRPGWHIECSAMSQKYIGDVVDIHGGGDDLIFPHHENEIAQSEAANGKDFVRYWMHNGMLTVNSEKMSKSLDNFFLLSDITKAYAYDVLRYFFLTVHYRSPMDFSDELLEASKAALSRLKNALNMAKENGDTKTDDADDILIAESHMFRKQFEQGMNDDFNTAAALAALHDLASFIFAHSGSSASLSRFLYDELYDLMRVLGLFDAQSYELTEAETKQVEALIVKRKLARDDKDYKKSDDIRDELLAMGVEIKDTREGTKWVYYG